MGRMDQPHTGWLKDAAYRKEYDAPEGELALAAALIRTRAEAGLAQEQLAERMGTRIVRRLIRQAAVAVAEQGGHGEVEAGHAEPLDLVGHA